MNTGWGRRLQVAAACGLVVAYAGLSQYCYAGRSPALGAALALIPFCALCTVLAWRWSQTPLAVFLTAGIAGSAYLLWPLLEKKFSLLYLAQESMVYCFLGLSFGRSLFGNRLSVCTRLADRMHGPLSPRELRYTRLVTGAWAMFFFSVAAVSLGLYWLAPLRIWSIYINLCVLPLVGAMFIAEYLVRRRVLPQLKRVGLLATVRVYFANP